MKRDLKRLANERYDLVVVGAGIYGSTLAWDAALRGLRVALVERGDFGCATSSNSLKIIHGGLRYLQQLDLARMRESFRERRRLMFIAPHLVHPLPVLMPTYGHKLKSRPVMALAMLASDIVGFDRNRLEDPQKRMPRSHTLSSARLKERIPGYDKHNLNGGALWFDGQCLNTERLLLSFVLSAGEAGADAANYLRATGFLRQGNAVVGVQVQDMESGDRFEIRSRLVVNDSGPWTDELLSGLGLPRSVPRFRPSSALNLVVNRPLADRYALGLSGPFRHDFEDGRSYRGYRMLFFAPWRGRTIIGTDHRPWSGRPDDFRVGESQIEKFLHDVNEAFPAAGIQRSEVSFFCGGLLPMRGLNPRTGEVQLVRHYRLIDHAIQDGIDGLVTVVGVKYTTARDVAEKTLDLAAAKLGRRLPPCRTGTTRLLGGDITRFSDFLADWIARRPQGLEEAAMHHLVHSHGSALDRILRYGEEDPHLISTLSGSKEVLAAEVVHAAREEMSRHLADVVLRRTDLGSAGHPGEIALDAASRIMAHELGWRESRRQDEVASTEQVYVPRPG